MIDAQPAHFQITLPPCGYNIFRGESEMIWL